MGRLSNITLLLACLMLTTMSSWNSNDGKSFGMAAARYLPTRSGGQEDRLVRLRELIRELLNESTVSAKRDDGSVADDASSGSIYAAPRQIAAASSAFGKTSQQQQQPIDGYHLMKRILLRQLENNDD